MGRLMQFLGWTIALGSTVLGIYVQTGDFVNGMSDRHVRAIYALEAATPIALGLVIVAAGHLILQRETDPI